MLVACHYKHLINQAPQTTPPPPHPGGKARSESHIGSLRMSQLWDSCQERGRTQGLLRQQRR